MPGVNAGTPGQEGPPVLRHVAAGKAASSGQLQPQGLPRCLLTPKRCNGCPGSRPYLDEGEPVGAQLLAVVRDVHAAHVQLDVRLLLPASPRRMTATSPTMNNDVACAQLDLLVMNTRRIYSLTPTFFLLCPTLAFAILRSRWWTGTHQARDLCKTTSRQELCCTRTSTMSQSPDHVGVAMRVLHSSGLCVGASGH